MKLCNNCVHLGKKKKTHFYVCLNSRSKLFGIPFLHSKTRKACNLVILKNEIRFIKNFRGNYKNSTFWIIGADPNLDFYSEDFFKNKLSIAVSASCIAFPNSTFLFTQYKKIVDTIRDARPDLLKRMILPMINTSVKNPETRDKLISWKDYSPKPIYAKPHHKPAADITLKDWKEMARRIFNDIEDVEFIAVNTIITFVIGIAVSLGAKRIILVGCGGKRIQDRWYAQKKGMWIFCPEKSNYKKSRDQQSYEESSTFRPMRRDIYLLMNILREYGVEVLRHRFDENRNKFIFEEIKNN